MRFPLPLVPVPLAGFTYRDGPLWTLYYWPHESNTGIYRAKLKVR